MSFTDDKQKMSTISSSTINFGIFSYNINRDENNEISSYNDICTDTNKEQSEYLRINKINSFQDSINSNNGQYFNFISNHEEENNDEEVISDIYFTKKKKDLFKTTKILNNKRGRKEGILYSNKKTSLANKKNNNKIINKIINKINKFYLY